MGTARTAQQFFAWRTGLPVPVYWDIISSMTGIESTNKSPGNILCKSCGLCCTGHLFSWTKLRAAEMDSAEALGLNVLRSDPRQRAFSQPCPVWHGQCTIYTSPHYPRFCHTYKCKLLKEVLDENAALPAALIVVQEAKELIHELEGLLPRSPNNNFRERLVEHFENPESPNVSGRHEDMDLDLRRLKARALLNLYENVFGVTDLVDNPIEE
jgi:hypothetical protein